MTRLAVVEFYIRDIRLQFLRRDTRQPVAQRDACQPGRLAGHHCRPRCVAAVSFVDDIGTSVQNLDAGIIAAKGPGADLRHDRQHTLPQIGCAGRHRDLPVAIQVDPHLVGRPQTRLFDEKSQPRADGFACSAPRIDRVPQRFPAELFERVVQQPGIVPGLEHHIDFQRIERTRVGDGGRRDQIPPPRFDRVDPDPAGNRVQKAFPHERSFVAARRAIRRRRGLVRQAHMPRDPVGRHFVRSQHQSRRHVRHAHAVGAQIPALVVKELVVDAENPAIGIDRRPDTVGLLARLVGGQQMFAPVLDPSDGTTQPQGGGANNEILGVKLAPDSETAANAAFEQIDFGPIEPQRPRDLVAVGMGALGTTVIFQPAGVGIDPCQPAAALQRHAGMPPRPQLQFNHVIRCVKGGVDIAIAFSITVASVS